MNARSPNPAAPNRCPGVRGTAAALILAAALVPMLSACGRAGSPVAPATPPPADDFAGESLASIQEHAERAYREGDFAEAQKALEEIRRRDPENRFAPAPLANCYLKGRAIKRADDLLRDWIAAHPEDIEARLVQARVFLRLGDLESAAGTLRAVLEIQPEHVVAHYNLGFIAYRGRHYDEADHHLNETIRRKPDLPEAHYTLGLTNLAQGQTEKAIRALEKAVGLNPRHVGAHFNLAAAYARAGRLQDAAREQAAYADLSGRSKAEKERDTQIRTSSVRAIRLIQDRKYEEALVVYQDLARQYPDHAPLVTEIAGLQIRLDRPQEAMASLRRAIAIDARLSTPHYLLAGLLRQAGDSAGADRELEEFATLETIPEGKSGY